MTRVVAVHQPNFLPWLGFFDKLARADVFVLLDDVQFPRTGAGTPVNRVGLMVANRSRWVTAPIVRSGGSVREIRAIAIDDSQPWRTRLERTVHCNYARAPGFQEVFPLVRELVATPTSSLVDFNERCIRSVAEALGLRTQIVRSSSYGIRDRGTQRLVELVAAAGGSVYLSGDGSDGYLEVDVFRERGLELVFQKFVHPEWPRAAAGLSIVDALMRHGAEGTRALLSRSRESISPSTVAPRARQALARPARHGAADELV